MTAGRYVRSLNEVLSFVIWMLLVLDLQSNGSTDAK